MKSLKKNDRILITGGTGLIGTNLNNALREQGYESNAIGSSQYDLRDLTAVKLAFTEYKPTVVFHLAAKVGGIFANNTYKADFYSDNVLINTHVVNESINHGVEYMFAMGTGCAYPKRLEGSVLLEKDFLDGVPEITNDAYAYAKRGLLVHLEALAENEQINYTYCLPANIYGAHDNYHPTHSHVVPGLIRRFCEAKDDSLSEVKIWGDGSAKRDFLYIDDCVAAMILLAEKGLSGPVNIATGELTSIADLAVAIKQASKFSGNIEHNLSFPTGQKERLFDLERIKSIGWEAKHSLEDGLEKTVEWFEKNKNNIRER